MAHLLTTIPRAKFPNWATAERTCQWCDGVTDRGDGAWYWLVNTANLPKQDLKDKVCFMVFDGRVRGYFDIIETDESENWRDKHGIGKPRNTKCIVMANWHPISNGPEVRGFQGWRYTHLNPAIL